MTASMIPTGTRMNLGALPARRNSISPCSRAVYALPGPPMGSTLLARAGSDTQSAMKRARSASDSGLHAASVPSPNMTYGLPSFTSVT